MDTIIELYLGIISARNNIGGVTIKNTFIINNDHGNKLTYKTLLKIFVHFYGCTNVYNTCHEICPHGL